MEHNGMAVIKKSGNRLLAYIDILLILNKSLKENLNTLRTGAFKLFKYTFPGSKQFKSTFILCFFKNL